MIDAPHSSFTEEQPSEGPVICAHGAVDRDGIRGLHVCLDEAARNSAKDVTVDLRETSFLDAAALQLLLWVSRRLARQGRRLSIVCPPGPALELFAVSGLHNFLTIYPTRETARRAERSRRWEGGSTSGGGVSPSSADACATSTLEGAL